MGQYIMKIGEELITQDAHTNTSKPNLMESSITQVAVDEHPTTAEAEAEAEEEEKHHRCIGDEIEIPVINHGIPTSVTQSMMQVCQEFFDIPTEENVKQYPDDNLKPVRFGTSRTLSKDTLLEWRDYLRCPCRPLSDFIDLWPAKPSTFREVTMEYSKELAVLAKRLCSAISESLGVESECLHELIGKHQQIIMPTYYPPCPNPELTIGLCAHTDPGGITILLQDEVEGLEVFKKGRWIGVKPLPDVFVVNLADQIQILTNGRYKGAEHRAIVNAERARISIPTFFHPLDDAKIAPIPELLGGQLPMYRDSIFRDYLREFFTNKSTGKGTVDSLKLD
ncbi:hypothetical protein O6H91_06G006500 [Diphasiastrum complanatum]|uniref:Uncharacterized protein n=1 Tax=Diphasiastrum complanatum TaxID=34168 RepID=A0ACC2DAU5_DIPCM|nr:hypothetical protein O6H91_06G006500 [Diphasiastrum complanatum]